MAGYYSVKGPAENMREAIQLWKAGVGAEALQRELEAQNPGAFVEIREAAIRRYFSSASIQMVAPKWNGYDLTERFALIEKWVKGTHRPQSKTNRELGQLIAGVGKTAAMNQAAKKPQPPKDDSPQVGDEAVVTVGGFLPPLYSEPTWVPGQITITIAPGMSYQPGEVFMVGKVGAEYVYLISQDQAAEAADGGDYTYLKIKNSTLARHFRVDRSQSEDQTKKSTGPQVTRTTARPTAEQTQKAVLKVVEEAENEERERLIREIMSNPIVVLPQSQVPDKSIFLYALEKARIQRIFEGMTNDQLKDFLREVKARLASEIPDKSTLESVAGY